jgi:hypothetical protein
VSMKGKGDCPPDQILDAGCSTLDPPTHPRCQWPEIIRSSNKVGWVRALGTGYWVLGG